MSYRIGFEAVRAGDIENALIGRAAFVDPGLDDLRSLKRGFDLPGIASGLDEKARRIAGLRCEFATHWHSADVRSFGRVPLLRQIVNDRVMPLAVSRYR